MGVGGIVLLFFEVTPTKRFARLLGLDNDLNPDIGRGDRSLTPTTSRSMVFLKVVGVRYYWK